MSSHEFDLADSYASQEALGDLFVSATAWLDKHGETVIHKRTVVKGAHEDGWPIIDGDPPFQIFAVPVGELQEVTPDAFEALEIADRFELAHFLPYYEYNDQDPATVLPVEGSLHITIKKSDTSPLDVQVLTIQDGGTDDPSQERWQGDRLEDRKGEMMRHPAAAIRNAIIEQQLGLNRITARECAAVQEVVSHLDEIVGTF